MNKFQVIDKISLLLKNNNIFQFNISIVSDSSKDKTTNLINITFKNKHDRNTTINILLNCKDFFNVIEIKNNNLAHTINIKVMSAEEVRKNKLNKLLGYD